MEFVRSDFPPAPRNSSKPQVIVVTHTPLSRFILPAFNLTASRLLIGSGVPSPGHFLLIEDAPNDALIFERTLREAAPGTTMFPCKNLATARNYLTGEKDFSDRARFPFPTAVLCDFRMGMDSGLDFLSGSAAIRCSVPRH